MITLIRWWRRTDRSLQAKWMLYLCNVARSLGRTHIHFRFFPVRNYLLTKMIEDAGWTIYYPPGYKKNETHRISFYHTAE